MVRAINSTEPPFGQGAFWMETGTVTDAYPDDGRGASTTTAGDAHWEDLNLNAGEFEVWLDRLVWHTSSATSAVTITELLDARSGVDVDGPARVGAVPGSRYRYANADFAIVELLVRDVTGVPFESFMQSTVLDPLEMGSSTFSQPLPESLRARATVEHDFKGKPLKGNRLHCWL